MRRSLVVTHAQGSRLLSRHSTVPRNGVLFPDLLDQILKARI